MKKLMIALVSIITASLAMPGVMRAQDNTTASLRELNMSYEYFPNMDGSRSTFNYRLVLMSKLLGESYEWNVRKWGRYCNVSEVSVHHDSETKFTELLNYKFTNYGTAQMIEYMTRNVEPMIFISAQDALLQEQQLACDKHDATLLLKPIALDAVTFVVHASNPIQSLTAEQITDIFTGKATNWKELGGEDSPIKPYIYENGKSWQFNFDKLINAGSLSPDCTVISGIDAIEKPYDIMSTDVNAIAFTSWQLANVTMHNELIKTIAVDGITPAAATIADKSYPYVVSLCAVINAATDSNDPAYLVYNALDGDIAAELASETGYVPLKTNGVQTINEPSTQIVNTFYTDLLGNRQTGPTTGIMIKTTVYGDGSTRHSKQLYR